MNKPHLMTGGRYPVLRALGIIYLILAAVAVAAGVVTAFWELVSAHFAATDRVILAIGTLVASFFMCVFMLGIAEVIKLFIDMERNTRLWAGNNTMLSGTSGEMPLMTKGRMADLDYETAEAALLRGH